MEKAYPSDLPPLLADPEKMKILLFNLLENAVKFNERGGKVLVEAEMNPARDGLRLRIINTRGEIPQDRLAELMKPFTQADMSMTRSASGLGLGLAVAKGIAEAHQGEFHIGSEKGKG
ncbi:MAG TPA: ATP-binding protein, partial [Candidatus Methylomirabilis sp.]